MSLVSLFETLKSKEIKLNLDDRGDLKVIGRRDRLDASLLAQIKQQKGAIVHWLKQDSVLMRPRIVPRARETNVLPTSFAQQRLWFIDQMGGGSPQYNLPSGLRIRGKFSEDIAERVLRRIIERHEPLRTVFRDGDDGPVQHIRERFQFKLKRVDLSGLTNGRQEELVREAVNADALKPFDLSADLMLRAGFIRLSEDEGVLLFNMHHIASDGWSMGILVNEFGALYEAFSRGEPDPLELLEVQYADYALWQREWLAGEVLERQLRYWEEQLTDLPQVHGLPLDHPRPAIQTFDGALHTFTLDRSILTALKQIALDEQATLFMVLQGVFALLLSRHSNSHDIVIGTPMANRLQRELEPLVGFFVNTLVLRTDCQAGRSFREFLGEVKNTNLNAQANQDVPFEYLVERLKPQRSTSHSPLFQIMFSMNTNEAGAGQLRELELTLLGSDRVAVKFDLTLDVFEGPDGLWLTFGYNTDLFEVWSIERLGEHFQNLARGVAANADERIEGLPLLSESEQRQLLYELNATAADYPRDVCLHELFEAQAERQPDAVALVYEDKKLSYRELNEQSNQLAHYLREQGVGPDVLVGLCVERSPAMVVGMLGILKCGGAYVPLDPTYPQERLDYMIADSARALVLTQDLLERLHLSTYSTQNLRREEVGLTPENLAYVIYTSGSTGKPKGAMVPHNGVANCIAWMQETYKLDASDKFLARTSLNFDPSVWEILWTLSAGSAIVLAREESYFDTGYLKQLIISEQITSAYFVPSMLSLFLAEPGVDQCRSLKRVISGGEPLSPQTIHAFYRLFEAELHHSYGPTETAIAASEWTCPRDADAVALGRPLANTQLYVLDAAQQLAPQTAAGELYVGGVHVGRGYLNRPDLTAARFVPDPFSKEPGQRLYRTGDVVRYWRDDNLEFLGRVDQQVKLRGFRIELGEIETALEEHEAVRQAVVRLREDVPGDKRLVAYVSSQNNASELIAELRQRLQSRLPDYMLPARFVVLDHLPLMHNGKVDHKQLPPPDDIASADEYIAPATQTEIALAQIWAELLKREANTISATANFFELGGHSLLSMRLLTQIRARWNVELNIRDVFEAKQLSSLALAIERSSNKGERPAIVRRARDTNEFPISFAQQRLWFIDQMGGGSPQYNLPGGLRVRGNFNEDIAERVLRRIIQRHEPLRTVFRDTEAGAVQQIREHFDFKLTRLDLRGLPSEEQEQLVREAANSDAQRPFDLSADLMLRAGFIRLSDVEGVLLFNMHHIASDGWSMGILVNEFSTLYEALSKGEPDPLKPLEVQYADYAEWQREWLAGTVLERQLSYWEQQLADLPQVHGLPLDHPRPAVQTFNGALHTFTLDRDALAALKQIALEEQATLFMVLQGVFALLLARHSNSHDIVIGTPVANRLQRELEPLVGFFVNTLVLRTDCQAGRSFREFLAQVKNTNLNAQANQDVPFEYLVERLKPQRSTSHSPLFQIMFSMNTTEAGATQLRELEFTPLTSDRTVVKFDLTLDVLEYSEGLLLSFAYNTDLFDPRTIERMAVHFETLLHAVAVNPQLPVATLPMLSAPEQQQLLVEWNDTARDYPSDVCVHSLFEAQVEQTPNALAVFCGEESLTYRELNTRANQLARYLRRAGVGPEVPVGILMERSVAMVVGILSVLKAGGAYLPLDRANAHERSNFMLRDAGAPVLLTQYSLVEGFAPEINTLCLDTNWNEIAKEEGSNLNINTSSANLAYVIYTSGSTGQPKGVEITHTALMNLVNWHQRAYGVTASDRATQLAGPAFDASVWEVWPYLTAGASIHIPDDETRVSASALLEWLANNAITISFLPTPLAELAVDEALPPSLRLRAILTGGDVLHRHPHKPPPFTLINHYGPTENTVVTTCAIVTQVTNRETPPPPIGIPIDNTQVYLLDSNLQPVPVGVAAELFIGGASLARGYHDRPELTAERFIPNPFSDKPGARLYRTGDLARYRPDGQIEFLGRLDNQVKVRGYRIELGEIEAALQQQPAVRNALVLAREDKPGDKRLIAYVSPQDDRELNQTDLRQGLLSRLPEYMVPARFVIMDQWPLTPNGKIDRKKLRAPDDSLSFAEYIAPETETEAALQKIWQEVLAIPSISVTANFFDIGGHSILATHLIKHANKHFGDMLEIRNIFQMQTIREMAGYLDRQYSVEAKQETPSNLLILKKEQSPATPLFLVHAVGGYAHSYLELALNLDYPGAMFGLQADDSVPPVIETMAAKYIETIEREQPHGPYLLGGWSMGGVVAYEIARQLIAAGESVDLLMMFDSFCPNTNVASMSAGEEKILLQTMAAELGITDEGLSTAERIALDNMSLPALMSLFIRLGKEQNRLPAEFTVDDLAKRYQMVLKNTRAVHAYRAQPLDIDIQLVRAQENRNPDWSLGWNAVARKVTVRELRGDHFSLLRQPNVLELGKVISKLMSELLLCATSASSVSLW